MLVGSASPPSTGPLCSSSRSHSAISSSRTHWRSPLWSPALSAASCKADIDGPLLQGWSALTIALHRAGSSWTRLSLFQVVDLETTCWSLSRRPAALVGVRSVVVLALVLLTLPHRFTALCCSTSRTTTPQVGSQEPLYQQSRPFSHCQLGCPVCWIADFCFAFPLFRISGAGVPLGGVPGLLTHGKTQAFS